MSEFDGDAITTTEIEAPAEVSAESTEAPEGAESATDESGN